MFILKKLFNPYKDLNLDYIGSKDEEIDLLKSKMHTIKVICKALLDIDSSKTGFSNVLNEIIKIIESN